MDKLIERCIAGDKNAFNDFITQYTRLVFSTIKQIFNKYSFSYNNNDLEDLHNSLFLSFMENDFKKLKQFKGNSQFSTYLRVVTVRFTLDHLRREKKQFLIDSIDSDDSLLQLADKNPAQEEVLEKSEAERELRKVIEKLAPDEQLLLKLAYYKELSPKEVSQIMGISIVAYYSKKSRIMGKIKNKCKKASSVASN